ncbi:MAG: hypothetical protein HY005_00575 [Candidatus Staskawiczbacteria bacterium]|nr:hypothetical protein [Candidatus Staskawiczbacteria bacterium]
MKIPHETNIEKRTMTMLRHLRSSEFRREKLSRPFIVEVTGLPDSGKSTILKRIDVFLRRQRNDEQECKILIPQEGTKSVRNIPRTAFQHSVAASNYALQILLQHSYSIDYDLLFFDRGLYDAWCFIEWLHQKRRLKKEESKCFKSFFTHEGWLKNIDICFFVMCDPKVAADRNRKDAFLTKKAGVRTDSKTIAELYSAFMTGYNYFKNQGTPVVIIDTSNLDIG